MITKESIVQFLKENPDVNKEIASSFFNQESVTQYLETDEGKKLLQPKLDKYHSQGLKSWKENNLQKLIEAEISKQFPEETEEQKLIRQLKSEKDALLAEKKQAELVSYAKGLASEYGVNAKLVERFVGADEAETKSLMELYRDVYSADLKSGVDAKLTDTDNTPQFKNNGNNPIITKNDFHKMSYSERLNLFTENPTLYAELNK